MAYNLHGICGIAAVMAGLMTGSIRAQEIVYEVPSGGAFIYSYITQGYEFADGAQLGGTSRYAQQMSVPVYSDISRSVTVTASLYATAPFDPSAYTMAPTQPGTTSGPVDLMQPGTPIWSSGPLTFSLAASDPFTPSVDYLVFNNINTTLPNTVFWSVQFNSIGSYAGGAGFGMIYRNAADVTPVGAATDANRFFVRNTSVSSIWSPSFLPSVPSAYTPPITSTFGVQLDAVTLPEPTTSMLSLCSAGLLFRRRRA